MKKIILTTLALMLSTNVAMAAGVYGNWLTQDKDAIIRIKKCGSGGICGFITKPSVKGSKDVNNKDPKLRGRAIKGMRMFKLAKTSDPKKWDGELYNPEDGKIYSGNVELLSDSKLKLEGCVLIFCKGQTWTKVK